MATYGPSYSSVVYIGSSQYRRYRAYLYCTTSETNTTVTISYTAKVQMADAAQYGVKIAVSGGNSKTGYLTSSSSSFKDVCTTTGTLSVTKGTSATTKTVTATASGTTVDGYGSAGGSASVSISVSIPAKPSYTVSYNANGGSGAPSSQTKWYGTTLTLSSTAPKRTGYNFLGWSTSSTATTATYKAGGSYTSNSAATLYAVWELAYVNPVISNLTAARCDASGNVTAIGRYAKVSFDWQLDSALTLASGTVACDTKNAELAAVEASAGSASEILGGDLDPLSAYSITATVKDSAGLSTSASATLAAEGYSLPTTSNVMAIRTDGDGNYDEEGTAGSISFAWSIDGMDSTNAVSSVAVGYREKGSTEDYIDLAATFEGTTNGAATASIAEGLLDVAKSYDVRMVVADQVSSITRTTVITKSFFTLDFKAGGKGIAIGKAAANDGFEVAMDASFEGQVMVRGHALTSVQQATFYNSSKEIVTDTATGWQVKAFDECKAKTDHFDDVATFVNGVVTFLKDGCYELSGNSFANGLTGQVGIGVFDGDSEEYSAFYSGPTIASAVLSPCTVRVSAGETRTLKRYVCANAGSRYDCYTWFTIKYLG